MASSPRAQTLRQAALETPTNYGSPSLHGTAMRIESPPWNERMAGAARRLWASMRRTVTPQRARGRREMYEEIREREEARRRSFAEGAEVSQRRSRILLRDSYDHQSSWKMEHQAGGRRLGAHVSGRLV